jgi:hypothetical protein
MLLDRKIFKVILSADRPDKELARTITRQLMNQYGLDKEDASYFLIQGSTSNAAYLAGGETINVLTKRGEIVDIAEASDLPNIKTMSKIVKKYYICWPKNIVIH